MIIRVGRVCIGKKDLPLVDRGDPPDVKELFIARSQAESGMKLLPVFLPTFNEEASELWLSLENLVKQQEQTKGFKFEVCLVLDGWEHASESMKQYLAQLFPVVSSSSLQHCLDVLPKDADVQRFPVVLDWVAALEDEDVDGDASVTVVVESLRSDAVGIRAGVDLHAPDRPEEVIGQMCITLVIKRENRRKFNSLIWYFWPTGFLSSSDSPFCFQTDCGTQLGDHCIDLLLTDLAAHSHAVASVPQTIQMSAVMQETPESPFSLAAICRAVISVDFLTDANLTGWLFSFGLARVFTGPCQLFRRDFFEGETLHKFFAHLKQPLRPGQIFDANMCLVEDFMLTIFSFLGDVAPEHRGLLHASLVPAAVHYFPLEDTFQKMMGQRRRWHNGNMGVYLWILRNSRQVWSSRRITTAAKVALIFHSFSSLLGQLINALSPIIFLDRLIHVAQQVCGSGCSIIFQLLLLCFLITYYLRQAISPVVWRAGLLTMFAVYSFHSLILIGTTVSSLLGSQPILIFDNIPLFLTLIHAFLIFCSSPSAFVSFLRSIPYHLLFFPFTMAIIPLYSLPLLWCIQWGNRPSNHLTFVPDHKTQCLIQESFRASSNARLYALISLIVLINLAVIAYPSLWHPIHQVLLILFGCVTIPQFTIGLWGLIKSKLAGNPSCRKRSEARAS